MSMIQNHFTKLKMSFTWIEILKVKAKFHVKIDLKFRTSNIQALFTSEKLTKINLEHQKFSWKKVKTHKK